MHEKYFLVVVYDISNDRRRTRLHKLLKNYGSPAQYSVFECLLTRQEITQMKQEVKKLLRPKIDHLRYYFLCKTCQGKTDIIGRVDMVKQQEVIVV